MSKRLSPLTRTARRKKLVEIVKGAQGEFEAAVRKALLAADEGRLDDRQRRLIDHTLGRARALQLLGPGGPQAGDGGDTGVFPLLLEEARTYPQGQGGPGTTSDSIEEQALLHARMRAYLLPPADLLVQARSMLLDLGDWGVPDDSMASLRHVVTADLGAEGQAPRDLARARASFAEFLATYDYWRANVDWYFDRMYLAVLVGGPLALVLLVGALACCFGGARSHPIMGLVLAGMAGTMTSILTKLPPLSLYREIGSFFIRMGGRFLAGVAASVIGLGLLTTGVLSVQLGSTSAGALSQCLQKDGEAAGCTQRDLFVLLALAILFGFSERALTTFEETVLGKGGPPARPPVPKEGAEPGADPPEEKDKEGAAPAVAPPAAAPPAAAPPVVAPPPRPRLGPAARAITEQRARNRVT